jgi:hypothetical protein
VREKGTLLGQLERDVLLGLLAGGPASVVLCLISGLASGLALSLLRGGEHSASVSLLVPDQTLHVLSTGAALLLCVLVFSSTRPRYPYLAWSLFVTTLLGCSVMSFLQVSMMFSRY